MEGENTSKAIKLVSQDGVTFEISKEVGAMSHLVSNMIDIDEPGQELPINNVKGKVLEKVIEFCTHHVNSPLPEIEKPLRSNKMSDIVPEWDAKFIDVDKEFLMEIILAANFMDIPSLMELGCATVASMIKGKDPEEIRKTFNIKNDFTPEEEAKVREENRWCEE